MNSSRFTRRHFLVNASLTVGGAITLSPAAGALARVPAARGFATLSHAAGKRSLVEPLSLAAAACLAAFAVQLGGRRGWLLYLSLMVTVFCAFLYSWPIQSLLPTYLKTELGYAPGQVTDVMRTVLDSLTSQLKDTGGNPTGSVVSPRITMPVTRLVVSGMYCTSTPAWMVM